MANISGPKVIGLGGLFFKSADPAATHEWYARVLGIKVEPWGIVFTPEAATAHPKAARSSCGNPSRWVRVDSCTINQIFVFKR